MKTAYQKTGAQHSNTTAQNIAIIYIVVSALWILLSDKIVEAMAPDIKTFTNIQIFKGWFFVLASGFFLYVLVKRGFQDRMKTETALHEAERKYRNIFENIQQGVFQSTPDGKFITANPILARKLGYSSPEELIHSINDIGHQLYAKPEQRLQFLKLINEGGTVEGFEFQAYRNDETIIWASLNAHIVRDEKGVPLYFEGTVEDITERKESESALESQRSFLRKIIDLDPNFIFAKDREGRFTLVNQAVAEAYGTTVENILGKTDADFNPNSDEVEFFRQMDLEVMNNLKPKYIPEEKITDASGTTRFLQTVKIPMITQDGRANQVLGVATDITESKRAEAALRHSEEQYRRIVETAEEGIWVIDDSQRTNFVNKKMASMLGYTVEEMIGKPLLEFMGPEWQTMMGNGLEHYKHSARVQHDFLLRKKNGDGLWALLSTNPIMNSYGNYSGALAMVTDITERKKSEEQLQSLTNQLRALAGRLQSIREEERTRISREIHDELGQSLTGLKMDLKWLEKRLPQNEPTLSNKLYSMYSLIDATIQTVRKISTELRPGVLELGLVAAIEWGCKEFESRTGIICSFTRGGDEPLLDDVRATATFRIFQELLTNIIRHSQATHVEVSLTYHEESLVLEVNDNGKGISDEEIINPHSLGLLGMRERALLIGGTVVFRGSPANGTSVTVTIPATVNSLHQNI